MVYVGPHRKKMGITQRKSQLVPEVEDLLLHPLLFLRKKLCPRKLQLQRAQVIRVQNRRQMEVHQEHHPLKYHLYQLQNHSGELLGSPVYLAFLVHFQVPKTVTDLPLTPILHFDYHLQWVLEEKREYNTII